MPVLCYFGKVLLKLVKETVKEMVLPFPPGFNSDEIVQKK
jgi:hypothetical protein